MALTAGGKIENTDWWGSSFDQGAFDPEPRRVFIAHTARDNLEVVDADTNQHVATLRGFPGAAGVVADKGNVLVTNRGSASLAWVDARTLETRAVLDTGPRPNGVAIVSSLQAAVVACIGDDAHRPLCLPQIKPEHIGDAVHPGSDGTERVPLPRRHVISARPCSTISECACHYSSPCKTAGHGADGVRRTPRYGRGIPSAPPPPTLPPNPFPRP